MIKVYFICIESLKHVSITDFEKRYIEVVNLTFSDLGFQLPLTLSRQHIAHVGTQTELLCIMRQSAGYQHWSPSLPSRDVRLRLASNKHIDGSPS
ncbi:hypothetical protein AVEN_129786-1 [Araneus ventricosus]|uniref:Uncharacterized protein n=1 Tax=Araneus ventricosus TaxID=182803 RepID=A0A4Y2FLM2_ARAVE|nr:hypothetical protein AVEN_129786-1 [Araneus ventricosus]